MPGRRIRRFAIRRKQPGTAERSEGEGRSPEILNLAFALPAPAPEIPSIPSKNRARYSRPSGWRRTARGRGSNRVAATRRGGRGCRSPPPRSAPAGLDEESSIGSSDGRIKVRTPSPRPPAACVRPEWRDSRNGFHETPARPHYPRRYQRLHRVHYPSGAMVAPTAPSSLWRNHGTNLRLELHLLKRLVTKEARPFRHLPDATDEAGQL